MTIGKDFNFGPVGNPFIDGGVRKAGIENGFINGIKVFNTAAENVRRTDYTRIEKTMPTPEERIEEKTTEISTAMVNIDKSDSADAQYDFEFGELLFEVSPERIESYKANFAVTSSRLAGEEQKGNAFFNEIFWA